ncbi:MAG TPA: protein kinase, partial [Polyangiaceae bacterium]|nr:protein kinase [Polyangiaceae bacterium]
FVKVLDFGVSKATAGTKGTGFDLTSTSSLMGSPRYMAPEQLRDARRVDPRADVWSLGVVLHELLAGESPFAAETLPELHVAILQGAPRPLRGRRPELSPALEAAIARCLEKDPDRRFPHVAAFAEALGPFAPPSARHAVERIASVLGLAPPTQHGPAPAPAPHAHVATSASLAAHPSAATSRPAGATATLPTPPPSHLASHAFASYPAGHASAAPPLGHASAAPQPPVGYASAPPPLGNASASYPAGHASAASYPPVGHASASSHPAGYASAASPSAGYTLPTPLPSAAPGRAPRAVPPTLADSPAPALLESAARPSNVYLPPSVPPAPAPVPFPFEGNWGREPAPLAPIPPPLAPVGSSSSRAIAAIVLAAIVLAVAFAGCAVCGGILLGL